MPTRFVDRLGGTGKRGGDVRGDFPVWLLRTECEGEYNWGERKDKNKHPTESVFLSSDN